MTDDEKRKLAFTDWATEYVDKWHPKKHGKDKGNNYHRGAVIAALAVAFAEYFEPMLAGDLEPEEEG